MDAATEFETERLVLRRPTPQDDAAFFALHGNPETNRFNYVPHDADIEVSRARLRDWMAHWQEHGFGYWMIALRSAPERIIGAGGLIHRTINGEPMLNLYYRFAPEVWGQGLASELATAAIDLGRRILPALPIAAMITEHNAPSLRVAERVGLQRAGTVVHEGKERLLFLAPR